VSVCRWGWGGIWGKGDHVQERRGESKSVEKKARNTQKRLRLWRVSKTGRTLQKRCRGRGEETKWKTRNRKRPNERSWLFVKKGGGREVGPWEIEEMGQTRTDLGGGGGGEN